MNDKLKIFIAFFLLIDIVVGIILIGQRQRLVKRATEPVDAIISLTNKLVETSSAFTTASPPEKEKLSAQLFSIASSRKSLLEKKLQTDPKTFLTYILSKEARVNLPQELKDKELVEHDVSLSGKFLAWHYDNFDNHPVETFYRLRTQEDDRQKTYNLYFTDNPPEILSGSSISLQAVGLGNLVVVAPEHKAAIQYDQYPNRNSQGNQKIAVVLVNFSDNQAKPFAVEEVRGAFFSAPNSVRQHFRESSYTQLSFSGDVFDWHTIPASMADDFETWHSQVRTLILFNNIDIDKDYDRRVFIFPRIPRTRWRGVAIGDDAYLNGSDNVKLAVHELGHTLGLAHAGALSCPSGRIIPWPTPSDRSDRSCDWFEYGDIYDSMGGKDPRVDDPDIYSPAYHYNIAFKRMLNWIPEYQITTIEEDGMYQVFALERSSSPRKGLRIARPQRNDNSFYYLEYRQPMGFDQAMTESMIQGVTIRIFSENIYQGYSGYSTLIDTNPETRSNFTDAPLRDGYFFYDDVNRILIRQIVHDAFSAIVQVQFNAPAPSLPTPTFFIPYPPEF